MQPLMAVGKANRVKQHHLMAKSKREVSESSFDFLHYSIVDTFSRWLACATGLFFCVLVACNWQFCVFVTERDMRPDYFTHPLLLCRCFVHSTALNSATRAHPEKDLELIGFQVGQKLAERYAKDKSVPRKLLCLCLRTHPPSPHTLHAFAFD